MGERAECEALGSDNAVNRGEIEVLKKLVEEKKKELQGVIGRKEAFQREKVILKDKIYSENAALAGLEANLEGKKKDLKLVIDRNEAIQREKALLKDDISHENATLAALEVDLYRQEKRIKDLKAELSAAQQQLQCAALESQESEADYQAALQDCKEKQQAQRKEVAMSEENYWKQLHAADAQIKELNRELRELGRREVKRESRGQYGSVLAGVVGVACGVLLQAIGALH